MKYQIRNPKILYNSTKETIEINYFKNYMKYLLLKHKVTNFV